MYFDPFAHPHQSKQASLFFLPRLASSWERARGGDQKEGEEKADLEKRSNVGMNFTFERGVDLNGLQILAGFTHFLRFCDKKWVISPWKLFVWMYEKKCSHTSAQERVAKTGRGKRNRKQEIKPRMKKKRKEKTKSIFFFSFLFHGSELMKRPGLCGKRRAKLFSISATFPVVSNGEGRKKSSNEPPFFI